MKTFYLSNDGLASRHKMRNTKIVGFGVLHRDQYIVAYLSDGKKAHFSYPDVKIGAHSPRPIINLNEEKIVKIDIITYPNKTVSRSF